MADYAASEIRCRIGEHPKTNRMKRNLGALALWLVLAAPMESGAGSDQQPPPPLQVGTNAQLFVDDWLVESVHDVTLGLHPPERREVVFRFDAPWEGPERSEEHTSEL